MGEDEAGVSGLLSHLNRGNPVTLRLGVQCRIQRRVQMAEAQAVEVDLVEPSHDLLHLCGDTGENLAQLIQGGGEKEFDLDILLQIHERAHPFVQGLYGLGDRELQSIRGGYRRDGFQQISMQEGQSHIGTDQLDLVLLHLLDLNGNDKITAGHRFVFTHPIRIRPLLCTHRVEAVVEELISPMSVLFEQIPHLLLYIVVGGRHVLREEGFDGQRLLQGGHSVFTCIGEGIDFVLGKIESKKEAGGGRIQQNDHYQVENNSQGCIQMMFHRSLPLVLDHYIGEVQGNEA